jgi:hypothetical protein
VTGASVEEARISARTEGGAGAGATGSRRTVLGTAGYRFRTGFARRWTGYLSLVVLVGLVGGVSMAAIAGARRTQSSFPTYLASTHPGDLVAFDAFQPATGSGYSARLNDKVAHLPYVRHEATVVGFDGTLQILSGFRENGVPGEAPPAVEGSPNGEYLTQDRATVLQGRSVNPTAVNEFMLSAGAARAAGLHLGSTVRIAFFSDAQAGSPDFAGYPHDNPRLLATLKLVGIIEFAPQVVQDDDQALGDQIAVLSPALTRQLEGCCAYYTYLSLALAGGSRHIASVEAGVNRLAPHLESVGGYMTDAPFVAKAERAVRPDAVAFGVFGAVAALAALVINGQVLSRLIRREAGDRSVLRALGASPVVTASDALAGVLVSVLVGALAAAVVAVALSPLAPIGPVRGVYPDKGAAFDWTVLGFGVLALVVGLGLCALFIAYRTAPHRLALRRGSGILETGGAGRLGRSVGSVLPPNARLGLEAALGTGAGVGVGASGRSAPVRSALLGAVVAVVLVVATIVFGSSLDALVSQPPLYGWNWDYALLAGFSGAENLPASTSATLLSHDPDVAHWAGVYFVTAQLDGQSVGMMATRPGAPVVPSLLSGHAIESAGQIVLGPATLASLHKHSGQTVVLRTDNGRSVRLRIVGTATLPTIGGSGDPSIGMGTGAVASSSLFPAGDLNQQDSQVRGPMAVLVSVRSGVSHAAALGSLERIVRELNSPSDHDAPVGGVVSALRPAEIADYGSAQSTPAVLAAVLALAAIGALGLTVTASVRGRRREFALLKALGFSRRQLASTVTWQSTAAAVVGAVVGIPLGIALGRWLWTVFADGINAVPSPDVPVLGVVAVAVGAIIFANLVALLPARIAARTSTAVLLRAE